MIDEIDYFPKRDDYKTRKKIGSDWNELKKRKTARHAKNEPKDGSKDESKDDSKKKEK